MTVEQWDEVDRLLAALIKPDADNWFAYGQCKGADNEAAESARQWGYRLGALPGMNDRGESPTRNQSIVPDFCWPVKPYLVRDRLIVDKCSVLIAAPDGPERDRSGTWTTVRYARRVCRDTIVVDTDGSKWLFGERLGAEEVF